MSEKPFVVEQKPSGGKGILLEGDPRLTQKYIQNIIKELSLGLAANNPEIRRDLHDTYNKGDLSIRLLEELDVTADKAPLARLAVCQKEVLESYIAQSSPDIVSLEGIDAGCERIFANHQINPQLETDKFSVQTINQATINPITSAAIDFHFNDPLKLPGYRDSVGDNPDRKLLRCRNLAIHGYLHGKFDDTNPQAEALKRVFRPYVTVDYPQVIRDALRPNAEFIDSEHRQDQVKKLKSFWPEVFSTYWIALARSEDATTEPVTTYLKSKRGNHDIAPDLSQFLPESEAKSLLSMNLFTARKKLMTQTVDLVRTYAQVPHKIDIKAVKAVFDYKTSHEIMRQSSAFLNSRDFSETNLEAYVHQLEQWMMTPDTDRSRIEQLIGDDYHNIPAIEKACLINFCAFVSNGAVHQGSFAVVKAIQEKLLPLLEKHQAVVPLNSETDNDELEDDKFVFDLDSYSQMAEDALARAKQLDLSDGLVLATDNLVTAELDRRNQELLAIFNVANRWYEKSLINGFKSGVFEVMVPTVAAMSTITLFLELENPGQWLPILALGVSAVGSISYNRSRVIQEVSTKLLQAKFPRLDLFSKSYKDTLNDIEIEIDQTKKIELRKTFTRLGTASALAILGTVAISKGSELARYVGLGVEGEVYSSRLGLGNSEEGVSLGNPRFYTYGEVDTDFWIGATCNQDLDSSNIDCVSLAIDEQAKGPVYGISENHTYEDEEDLKTQIQELVSQGNIVRFNTKNSNFYEIPYGYYPTGVLFQQETWASAEWHPATGLIVTNQNDGHPLGVVYTPFRQGEMISPNIVSQHIPNNDESLIDPNAYDTTDLRSARQIVDWAKDAYENQAQNNLTTRQILAHMQQWIKDQGVDYGFQDFDGGTARNATDKLIKLLSRDEHGDLVNDKWICNQYSYALYALAKSAGINNIGLVQGFAQSDQTNWGGYNSQLHQLLIFQESDGSKWELFEATLPSQDPQFTYPHPEAETIDFFEAKEQSERNTRRLVTIMAGVLATTGGALVVEKGRKKINQKLETKKRQRLEQILSETPEEVGINVLHTVASVVDYYNNTEVVDKFRQYKGQTVAQGLAGDLVSLLANKDTESAMVEEATKMNLLGQHEMLRHQKKNTPIKSRISRATRERIIPALDRGDRKIVNKILDELVDELGKQALERENLAPEQVEKILKAIEILSVVKN